MLYAVGKGDLVLVYRAPTKPLVLKETIDVPARERVGRGKWQKVTARLVRLTVSKGVEVHRLNRYLAHIYMGFANVPQTGEVKAIPREYHTLFPERRARHARRRH